MQHYGHNFIISILKYLEQFHLRLRTWKGFFTPETNIVHIIYNVMCAVKKKKKAILFPAHRRALQTWSFSHESVEAKRLRPLHQTEQLVGQTCVHWLILTGKKSFILVNSKSFECLKDITECFRYYTTNPPDIDVTHLPGWWQAPLLSHRWRQCCLISLHQSAESHEYKLDLPHIHVSSQLELFLEPKKVDDTSQSRFRVLLHEKRRHLYLCCQTPPLPTPLPTCLHCFWLQNC